MTKRIIAWITVLAMAFSLTVIPAFSSAEVEGNYTYSDNGDGSVTITKCAENARGKVTIPDTLGGKSVTAIADRAFYACNDIESITIPEGIKQIGKEAFMDCGSLMSVTLSSSIEKIGEGAFANCTSFNEMLFSAANMNYSIIDNVLYEDDGATLHTYPAGYVKTFTGVASINAKEASTLEEDVGSVGDVTVVTTFEVPASVTKICDKAFYGNTTLTAITVSNSVSEIGAGAFACCGSLENIYVSEGNANFTTDNQIVYTKDMTEMVACPSNASLATVAVSADVQKIRDYAFAGCTGVEDFAFETGEDGYGALANIGSHAFYKCSLLRTMTIPESVDIVGAYAFSGCSSLENIQLGVWMTAMNDFMLEDCISLTTVEVSDSIETIGTGVFKGCSSLASVTVIPGNAFFNSYDGVLYNGDNTELIVCPPARETMDCEIVQTTTKIRDYAFYAQGENLIRVLLPIEIKTIGEYAFANSENIFEIEFEGDLPQEFAPNALEGMNKGLTIFYRYDHKDSFAPNDETTFRGYKLECADAPGDDEPTDDPIEEPTIEPTAEPTIEPTAEPTVEPTIEPTVEPTIEPIIEPTVEPTIEPTMEPTFNPTTAPTTAPMPTGEPVPPPTGGKDGDLNGDNKINSKDIALMQKHIIGMQELEGENRALADVTEDGKINSRDLAYLQKIVLGKDLSIKQKESTEA